MSTLLKSTNPIARKEHKCDGCLEVIKKGDQYSYYAGINDGDFTQSKMCNPCEEYFDANNDRFEDGAFMPGEIGEMRKEDQLNE